MRIFFKHLNFCCTQALFFPLRTTRDELASLRQQENARAARAKAASPAAATPAPKAAGESSDVDRNPGSSPQTNAQLSSVSNGENDSNGQQATVNGPPAHPPLKVASDYAEELMTILKTAYPLLALTLETLVDQMLQKFRATAEEEVYRFICMLLQEAMNVSII